MNCRIPAEKLCRRRISSAGHHVVVTYARLKFTDEILDLIICKCLFLRWEVQRRIAFRKPVRNHRECAKLALIQRTRKPCQRVLLEAQHDTAYNIHVAHSQQGCVFGFFDDIFNKFGFFSRPLASKTLFRFLAFFLLNLAFFWRQLTSAIIVYLCTISVQNFSISRRKSRLVSYLVVSRGTKIFGIG